MAGNRTEHHPSLEDRGDVVEVVVVVLQDVVTAQGQGPSHLVCILGRRMDNVCIFYVTIMDAIYADAGIVGVCRHTEPTFHYSREIVIRKRSADDDDVSLSFGFFQHNSNGPRKNSRPELPGWIILVIIERAWPSSQHFITVYIVIKSHIKIDS
jgi:hypothetical protein